MFKFIQEYQLKLGLVGREREIEREKKDYMRLKERWEKKMKRKKNEMLEKKIKALVSGQKPIHIQTALTLHWNLLYVCLCV